MKIRGSITVQVFLIILAMFLLVLTIQTLFLANYFEPFYNFSMFRDIRKEFDRTTKNFSGVGEESVNARLREYAIEYQAPVLVCTEDYRILDRYFFDQLNLLTLKDDASHIYVLPVDDQITLDDVYVFEQLYVEAHRLGESRYYDPVKIRSADKTYYAKHTAYYDVIESETVFINPVRSWYLQQSAGRMTQRALLIYDQIRNCLIERSDIAAHLEQMTEDPFTDSTGTVYYFFSQSRRINGVMTHFLTVRPIVLTGSEARYFNRYFYYLLTLLLIIFLTAAYFLSRRLSSPILKLSGVTAKLAARDFSVRSSIHAKNEIGRLSVNINMMADNLEKAIAGLEQTAETSHVNETRMKSLLADLAHEFKTPLGIIALYFEVIEKGVVNDESPDYFRLIEHEIENLTQMVDDAIQFTKMQAGYMECRPAPVELRDLMDTALARFSEELESRHFTTEVQPLDVTVMADGRRIEQVFTNLISNAVKYSETVRRISITAEREKESVRISVSNYGHVSDEDLSRIWERYYRASNEDEVRLPSQGIGLEIVRGILTMHGSNFGVEHDSEKITFFFSLHVAEES
jgi:two-component system, OmpR family, sensor histidine kinase VanS